MIIESMKEKRNTWQKKVIYSALKEMDSHPTAQELYEVILRKGYNVGRSTVYRVLADAVNDGDIDNVYAADNKEHFDGDTRLHYHMRCKQCGRIYDSDVEYNPDINRMCDLIDKDFTILRHNLEFVCICPECK